jgi:hypothetical protein
VRTEGGRWTFRAKTTLGAAKSGRGGWDDSSGGKQETWLVLGKAIRYCISIQYHSQARRSCRLRVPSTVPVTGGPDSCDPLLSIDKSLSKTVGRRQALVGRGP